MRRLAVCAFGVGVVLLGLALADSAPQGDVQAAEPSFPNEGDGQGILKKLFRKNRQEFPVAASFAGSALKITCPSGTTSRPFDFTSCGEGPELTEVIGTLLNDDLSFIISGVTTAQPVNWNVQFSTGGPGTGVFMRAEIMEPFESLDSDHFDVVETGGTSCDKDCGFSISIGRIAPQAKQPAQGKPQAGKGKKGNMHIDPLAAVHTPNDDVIITGKLPPSGKKTYGMIVRRTAAGVRSPLVKKAVEIDSDNDKKADRYIINFGKQQPGTYSVRVRSTKKAAQGSEWIDQDTLVRAAP